MGPNENPAITRHFTVALQSDFSRLSGDYNPMHADPVAARRTLAGGQVVHGIHQALAAMETALTLSQQQDIPIRAIAEFTALFLKPVLVGEIVRFRLTDVTPDKCQVMGSIDEDPVCRISLRWGSAQLDSQAGIPPLRTEPIAELLFAELTGKSGTVDLGLDAELAHKTFPRATASLGLTGIAEVLALSRLVGVHCPGLHSLFSQCAMVSREAPGRGPLNYRVEQTDERFGKITMRINGPRMEGQVTAFFRPPPEQQPGMAAVARHVEPGTFSESIALIVGGSRGLGEITARIVAAGGGLPILTYHQGAADAERIANDIRSFGGRCDVRQLDIRDSDGLVHALAANNLAPRSIYYFATPKIFGRRRGFFDHEMLREFQEAYVTAFGRLIDQLAANCATTLRVFYPSSVAVTENMREMAEYAMAKRAGEELCAFYNRHAKNIEIIVERLPRIRTDQTSTLLPVPAEDALAVMLPLVRRVETR